MQQRLPRWLKKSISISPQKRTVEQLLQHLELHTVCEHAKCMNKGECYSRGTVTFMILGDKCTRTCKFCAVPSGPPLSVDDNEPQCIAFAVRELKLQHVVITSVTRDDLPDKGAYQFIRTVSAIRSSAPDVTIELLVPDFQGITYLIDSVVSSSPDVLAHNLETIPRLYPFIRPEASYSRSLSLLEQVKRLNRVILTKSGIMLGLGEQYNEVLAVMDDLREVNCDILTLGQYLRPSPGHLPVHEFISPQLFHQYKEEAITRGFKSVFSAPKVRSSYYSGTIFDDASMTSNF